MMKRIFSILCLLFAFIFLFAGCVQKKEEGAGATASATTETEEEKFSDMTPTEQRYFLHDAFLRYLYPDSEEDRERYGFVPNIFVVYEKEGKAVVRIYSSVTDNWVRPLLYYELYGKKYDMDYHEYNSIPSYEGAYFFYQHETCELMPFLQACEKGIVTEAELNTIVNEATPFPKPVE